MNDFLGNLVSRMQGDNGEDFRIKEACMFVLQHIHELIEQDENLINGMEKVLEDHVFAELTSESPILRARALQVYASYSLDTFQDNHVEDVGMKIMVNMTDDNPFPV